MVRFVLSGLFGLGVFAGMLLLVPQDDLHAQQKEKEKTKAKEQPKRIAINDPNELKDNKDFAIQGEYTGVKVGVQVIARGEGTFAVKVLGGGLPGAGWDGKTEMAATAKLDEKGTAIITGKDVSGTITEGKLTIKAGPSIDATLSKVERKSPTLGAKAPADAVVLFGESGDEKNWNGGKLIELSDGKYLNTGIKTKQAFTNFKAHIEFRLPWMPNSTGQGRGNSGFYLQDRYEVQVLDSFGLKGENNECGGIYTLFKPSVNMCLPPMLWQTYDIDFTAAKFEGDKKVAPAKLTLIHNGVKIHDAIELKGATGGGQKEAATPGPIQLQNHGDPLVFRNAWIVEVK